MSSHPLLRRAGGAAVLVAGLALSGCTGFHEVSPGQIYRDRQPAEDELYRTIQDYGIRTVVMLRGAKFDTSATRRAALAADIDYLNLPMSARSLPPPERLLSLWEAIEHAKRPILFHCRAGVDRTGLAVALAVLHDTGDLDAARDQLDLIPYGHTGWFGTGAMDEILDRYEPHHGRMAFSEWVTGVYAAAYEASR